MIIVTVKMRSHMRTRRDTMRQIAAEKREKKAAHSLASHLVPPWSLGGGRRGREELVNIVLGGGGGEGTASTDKGGEKTSEMERKDI